MWRRGRSYARDLRDRVLAAVDDGMAAREAAPLFRVSISYIYKALIRRRKTGDSGANENRGHRSRKLSPAQERALADRIRSEPDITLARPQEWPGDRYGVRLSNGGIWAAVKRLGFTFKKTLSASEQERPDVAARGAGWKAVRPFIDPERLVFIDETALNTKMTRLYGRAPRGRRLESSVPFGHWKTMTFIAALRCDGITAPWLLDGAMDGDAFRTYVEHVLVPSLQEGDSIVMDNPPTHKMATHKMAAVRDTLARAGMQAFYLPPYSPDMNPIEMAFAKLKALLRQDPTRTIDALWRRLGTALDTFTPDQCANFFRHAGYPHST
jgi:transposase